MEGQPTAKLRILLLPGHSHSGDPGALSQCALTEHDVALYMSQVLSPSLQPDFDVNIFDSATNDLKADGAATKGYDIVLLIHGNAFDKSRNYSTVCVASKWNKPQDANTKLGSKIAIAISKAININAYAGPLFPVGIMPSNLEVLNAAHKNGVKYALLVEPFFVDYYASESILRNCCDYAMQALSDVLRAEFLGKRPLIKRSVNK